MPGCAAPAKNAVLKAYMAQILTVSCAISAGWRGPTPLALSAFGLIVAELAVS
jgi:hypothetical protein